MIAASGDQNDALYSFHAQDMRKIWSSETKFLNNDVGLERPLSISDWLLLSR